MKFRQPALIGGFLVTLVLPFALLLSGASGFDPRQQFAPPGISSAATLAVLLGACALLELARRAIGDAPLWRTLCLVTGAAWFAALPLRGFAGDMPTWLKFAYHPFVMASEPLGRWTHWLAFEFLALLGVASGQAALSLASICTGLLATWFMLEWGPRAFPRTPQTLLLALLWLHPTALFFHAYPETTHLSYALLLAALLSGINHLRATPQRPPWLPGWLFALGAFGHGAVCFATGAQAYLIARWYWLNREQRPLATAALLCSQPFLLLAGTIVVCKIAAVADPTMFVVGNITGGQDGSPWIAFSHETKSQLQYVFLESRYLRELGIIFLASGLGVALLPWALARKDHAAAFLSAALAGLLVLALFWNADLGILIDLDLLSFFALPLGLLILAAVDELDLVVWKRASILLAPSALHFALITSGLLRLPFPV